MTYRAKFVAVTLSVVVLTTGGFLRASQAQESQGQVQPEETPGQVQERAVPAPLGRPLGAPVVTTPVTPVPLTPAVSPPPCAAPVRGLGPGLDAANELMNIPWCPLARQYMHDAEQNIQ